MRNDAQANAPASAPASAQAPLLRPENRCRSDAEAAPLWDTRPACLRSEAFAEDLPLAAAGWAGPAPTVGRARARARAPALSLLLASLLSSR